MQQVHHLLKEAQLKITRQREAILQLFLTSDTRMTADEIYQKLREAERPMGLSTIYRTLTSLYDHGILEKADIPGSSSGSFYLAQPGHRHHLVCVCCKQSIVLEHCPVEQFSQSIGQKYGYTITGHSFEIFGICPACRKKSQQETE